MGDLLTWPRFPFFVRVLVAVNAKFKTLFLSSMVSAGLISGLWVEPGCAAFFGDRGPCGGRSYTQVVGTGRTERQAIANLGMEMWHQSVRPCPRAPIEVTCDARSCRATQLGYR